MNILFTMDPLDNNRVDFDYENEYNAAKSLGLNVFLFNFETLTIDKDIKLALRKIKPLENKENIIYRGWMLTPEDYRLLYEGLLDKNLVLINSPEEYKHCHYLPESYLKIKEHTPLTIWQELSRVNDDFYQLIHDTFKEKPIIIKDYVKSRKHDWDTACFIANANDKSKVQESIQNFIRLQGEELNVGIVVREFIELSFLEHHKKSNMPLSKEFRIIFFNKKPIAILKYWDEGEYGDLVPDLSKFLAIAETINSSLFSMDIAQKANQDWIIIEIGDGQVSGLPEHTDLIQFYKNFIS